MLEKFRKALFKSTSALFLACLLFIAGCSHETNSSHITTGHKSSGQESSTPYTASYQIDLPSSKAPSVKIDLSQHDAAHHSDIILIKTEDDAGIKNTGTKPLQLKVKTSGFPEEVKFKTSDENFDLKTGVTKKPLGPGETLKLDFETTVIEKPKDSAQICNGYIHIINEETGKEVGAVNVLIMDSKINNGQIKEVEDCCSLE